MRTFLLLVMTALFGLVSVSPANAFLLEFRIKLVPHSICGAKYAYKDKSGKIIEKQLSVPKRGGDNVVRKVMRVNIPEPLYGVLLTYCGGWVGKKNARQCGGKVRHMNKPTSTEFVYFNIDCTATRR